MRSDDLLLLGGLFVMWVGISRICFAAFACPEHLQPRNNKGKKSKYYYDYYGNYVSICHAVIAMILGGYVILTEGVNFGIENTFIVKVAISNTLAYFIYDTLISEYHRYNTLPMTLHHIGALLCAGSVFIQNSGGSELAFGLLLAESSNPFNLTREILRHWKLESSKRYLNVSLAFASLFIISRFAFFPYFLTYLYPSNTIFMLKITFAFIWFVSWHWLFIIFNFAVKELKNFVQSEDKNSDKRNVWNMPYAVLSRLRKNKAFLVSFYLGAAWMSFGTLYLSHPRA